MEEQFLDKEIDKPTPQYNGYATFGERFGAAFLDGIILSTVGYMILGAFGISFIDVILSAGRNEDPIDIFGNDFYWASILSIAFDWFYYVQQESSDKMATLGKQVMGIVVTDMNGERLGIGHASVRFVVKQIFQFVSLLSKFIPENLIGTTMILSIIGYLMQPFTKEKQALHDIVAKTLVYRKKGN
jgi:uncharacterized RDD family membrane protein YckC